MKDETWGMPVECFVGLKAKMYTYITEEDHERKKSIHKNIIDDTLKYEDYKNIMSNVSYMRHETNRI